MASNIAELIVETAGVGETEAFAARLSARLAAGDRLALRGDLGAGKTAFVRGLAHGLGHPDPREIASPTFAIHHRYEGGRLTLDHLDVYRLRPPVDLVREGLELILEDAGTVLCCEWAERLAAPLPGLVLSIQMEVLGEDRRRITCRATPGSGERLLQGIAP